MLIKDDILLEGKSVRLIPMSLEHLDGLFEASNHSEIWNYSPSKVSKPEDLENMMNMNMKLIEQGLKYSFVIFDKDSNEIVGQVPVAEIWI